MLMSFSEMVPGSLCRNSSVMQSDCYSRCTGGSYDLGGEDAGYVGIGIGIGIDIML